MSHSPFRLPCSLRGCHKALVLFNTDRRQPVIDASFQPCALAPLGSACCRRRSARGRSCKHDSSPLVPAKGYLAALLCATWSLLSNFHGATTSFSDVCKSLRWPAEPLTSPPPSRCVLHLEVRVLPGDVHGKVKVEQQLAHFDGEPVRLGYFWCTKCQRARRGDFVD